MQQACNMPLPSLQYDYWGDSLKSTLSVLMGLFLLGSLIPNSWADDWPMGYHDASHSGRTAEIVAPPLTLVWTWKDTDPYDTDPRWAGQTGGFSFPIYYQGRLY